MPDTAIYIQMVLILQQSVCYLLLAACCDLFPVRRFGNFADRGITENVRYGTCGQLFCQRKCEKPA